MSKKGLEDFQTLFSDEQHPPTLPSNTAQRLATRPDYLPSVPRVLSRSELAVYNGKLTNESKEAADAWLNELWAPSE